MTSRPFLGRGGLLYVLWMPMCVYTVCVHAHTHTVYMCACDILLSVWQLSSSSVYMYFFVSHSCCVLACMIELGMCHPGHYCASVASVPDLTVVRLFAVPILAGTLLHMLLTTFSLKFLFLCHMSFGKFGCF